jgi:hypothetical protein
MTTLFTNATMFRNYGREKETDLVKLLDNIVNIYRMEGVYGNI